MKARIKWLDGVAFVGESGSGHSVVMDGAKEYGGRDIGIRPMEMLLLGLGGCSAFDVLMILKRGRQPVVDCIVDIQASRAETDPKIFTGIHLIYIVTGKGLSRDKVKRAVGLSAEKYCSASVMLGKTAELTHEVIVIDGEATKANPICDVRR
ncbi:MAG: OsmC family protein [Rhodospirillales bacterium]|jgi:putative redox protein